LAAQKGEKMTKLRYTIFVSAVFFALLLSAMNTVSAFADEISPPPTEEATSPEVLPVENETGDVDDADEGLTSFDAVDEEANSSDEEQLPVMETILEQLPENTELVVLDENGESLSLASQAATDILANSDPQWCPTGTTPGSSTCSGVKTSFNGGDPLNNLIEWLKQNQPGKAGVIWIESGYVGTQGLEGGAVILDGLDFVSMDNFALTINGGWTGSGTILDPNSPSTFEVPFLIINWNAPVTINNILITSATGTTAALEVVTKGNIILNNVDVEDNTTDNGGAYINNTSGAGTVLVNESNFNGNSQGSGLRIYSKGVITLKNVSAINNELFGAYIDNSTAGAANAVTLNGFNNFSYNGWEGLTVYSRGVVTLNNITAVYNEEGSGAYIENTYGYASAVIVKGVNSFNNNGWDGLRIYSTGGVTLNSVMANNNGTDPNRLAATYAGPGGDGIQGTPDDWYDYDAYGKGLAIFNWGNSPKPVTLTGTNMFNDNASNGLYIDSNGLVKVNNITANFNDCDPAYDIDTYGCAGAYISGGGVAQTGYGIFVGNAAQGLEVYNAYVPSVNANVGAIALTNLYAEGNGEGGVWAVTSGNAAYNVSITGFNVFNSNTNGEGLFVWSNGIVSLSNVTANTNDYSGVSINNTSSKSPKAVTISGTNIFNDNGDTGLYVSSNGPITTNNITAIYNLGSGVFLDNCGWDWNISDCTGLRPDNVAMLPQAVSMNGTNNTSWNDVDGVMIVSLGAIKFSNLNSNWNSNLGGYFYNAFKPLVTVGVTQTGYATFLDNLGLSGFNIYSTGVVSLANVTANGNQTYGGVIMNDFNSAKPTDVLLNGVNTFIMNGKSGLWITSFGTVTLNNVTANENGFGGDYVWNGSGYDFFPFAGPHYGVDINNSNGTTPRAVVLNGINTFNYNNGSGLSIVSRGEIKVSKVNANFNEDIGALLFNQSNVVNAPVTLFGYGIFNNNAGGGLGVVSNGNIITNNVTANDNNDDGVYMFNDSITALPSLISMLGVNTFNNNNGDGLLAMTDGLITLFNITANNNTGWGTYLDNVALGSLSASRGMVLNGTNNFNSNTFGGLYFNSTGSVILNRVTAGLNYDGVPGGFLRNGIEGYSYKDITLACGSTFLNEGYGYYFDAAGLVTLAGVFNYGSPTFVDGLALIKSRPCTLP